MEDREIIIKKIIFPPNSLFIKLAIFLIYDSSLKIMKWIVVNDVQLVKLLLLFYLKMFFILPISISKESQHSCLAFKSFPYTMKNKNIYKKK